MQKTDFPLYRKYYNGRSYFKVESFEKMTEYQIIGDKYSKYAVAAEKFPERMKIKAIAGLSDPAAAESSPEELNSVLKGKTEI